MLRRSPLRSKRPTPRRKGKPAPKIKPKREDDPEHLDRLREFGCWCCRVDGLGWVAAEPHHPRTGGKDGPGASQRAPDRDAIPLCRRHHNEQHPDSLSIHRNPIEFRDRYGTEAEIRDKVAKMMAQTLETLYNGTEG